MIAAFLNSPFNFGAPPAPPPGGDPYFDDVVLLLHCDGTNGSTTFTDNSSAGHAMTARGSAQVTTTDPKYGTGAVLLDGTGDYLETPIDADFNFGTGDFTIECFVRFGVSIKQYIFDYSTANTSMLAITPSSGNVQVYSASSFCINAGSTAFSTGVWYHIALSRAGGDWRIYRDGTEYAIAAGQGARSFGFNSRSMYVGSAGNGTNGINGRVDEFRITKGVARYTANFTPPTAPFPDS